MPQQINLCTPILLKPKHYFSAQTMVQTLAVFLVFGGALSGAWVWNLQQTAAEFSRIMVTQSTEIESLNAAILRSRAAAAPADPALVAQLQGKRISVQQREKLLEALQQGMLEPGWGHSDRLLWVARSIPRPVWLSDITIDKDRFDVTGFTLEPAALNEWVGKLSASPLMSGLQLATVRVESAVAGQVRVPSSSGAAPVGTAAVPSHPIWSFSLFSATPPAPTPTVPASGVKP
jgi:hypothetical protein